MLLLHAVCATTAAQDHICMIACCTIIVDEFTHPPSIPSLNRSSDTLRALYLLQAIIKAAYVGKQQQVLTASLCSDHVLKAAFV